MNWDFLDIFKKAHFNTLMFSAAITAWIFLYIYPENNYILGAAIFCSIYCLARLAVYIKNYYKEYQISEENRQHKKQQEDKKIRDNKLQAQYVYDRLSEENQKMLSHLVKIAKKSAYSDVYILEGSNPESLIIIPQINRLLYGDAMIEQWISINESIDSYSVYIKSPLNKIIESNS